MIVTIARQFGSGGRKIGKLLSEKLDIAYYDKNLLTLVAKESGLDPDVVEGLDEKATNSFLYSLSIGAAATLDNGFRIEPQMPLNDKLFIAQHDVIRQISADPCVIVGRCADYALADYKNAVHIFIHADEASKIERLMKKYDLTEQKAREAMIKKDRQRQSYYNYYSSKKWGRADSYDLTLNSAKLGIEGTVELIKDYVLKFEEK